MSSQSVGGGTHMSTHVCIYGHSHTHMYKHMHIYVEMLVTRLTQGKVLSFVWDFSIHIYDDSLEAKWRNCHCQSLGVYE